MSCVNLDCVSSTTRRRLHRCMCEVTQRWGRWVRDESVLLSHLEKDGPDCVNSWPRGHSSPGGRCILPKEKKENRNKKKQTKWRSAGERNNSLYWLTFNCVSETFRGGGVVRWCVKGVNLKTVCYILGLWETLHHRPVDVPCWVPPDGRCFSICREKERGSKKKRAHSTGSHGLKQASHCCRWFPVCRSPLHSHRWLSIGRR